MKKWISVGLFTVKTRHTFQSDQVQLEPDRRRHDIEPNMDELVFHVVRSSIEDGLVRTTLVSQHTGIRLRRFPLVEIEFVRQGDEVRSELTAKTKFFYIFTLMYLALIGGFALLTKLLAIDIHGNPWFFAGWAAFSGLFLLLVSSYKVHRRFKRFFHAHFIEQTYLKFGRDASESNS